MISKALELLKKEEGYRQFLYTCSEGKTTIGYGFNLDDTGLSKEESSLILELRISKIEELLFHEYTWFRSISSDRQSILISMVYQLGFKGFKSFKKMIKALADKDYDLASEEGLDSLWSLQTPTRAIRHMEVLRRG